MKSLMIMLVVFLVSVANANVLYNPDFDDASWWLPQGESGVAGGVATVSSTAGGGAQIYQITYLDPAPIAPAYLIEARVRTAQASDGTWGSGVDVQMYGYGWALIGNLTYTFDEAEKAEGMNIWHDISVEIDTSAVTEATWGSWGPTASLR